MSIIPGIESRAPLRTETQQRVGRVAEPLARLLLEARERLVDRLVEPVGRTAAAAHVGRRTPRW